MSGKKRLSTPALALVTALAPTVLIIIALAVAMFVTDGAETVIVGGIAATLAAFYLLRWRLLRRRARRVQAAAIQRTGSDTLASAFGRSWPVNGSRSPVVADVRERVS